jgi:hypothetical protein
MEHSAKSPAGLGRKACRGWKPEQVVKYLQHRMNRPVQPQNQNLELWLTQAWPWHGDMCFATAMYTVQRATCNVCQCVIHVDPI